MPEKPEFTVTYTAGAIRLHHELESTHGVIKVFSLGGQLLVNELVPLSESEITMAADLPPGIYSIYIETQDETVSEQFFVP